VGRVINHIVLFKLRDPEDAAELVRRLDALEGQIPEVRHLEAGADVTRSERSFDVALVSSFASVDDLNTYRDHPDHMKLVRWIGEVTTDRVAVDYEGRGLPAT
jgi:hypothetical protein